MSTICLSAIVADTGWHWMLDRADVLRKTPWPQPSVEGLAMLAFWIAGLMLAAGGVTVLARRLRIGRDPALPPTGASAD